MNALGEKESTGAEVIKLSSIVALDGLYGGAKLGGGIRDKVSDGGKRVRF